MKSQTHTRPCTQRWEKILAQERTLLAQRRSGDLTATAATLPGVGVTSDETFDHDVTAPSVPGGNHDVTGIGGIAAAGTAGAGAGAGAGAAPGVGSESLMTKLQPVTGPTVLNRQLGTGRVGSELSHSTEQELGDGGMVNSTRLETVGPVGGGPLIDVGAGADASAGASAGASASASAHASAHASASASASASAGASAGAGVGFDRGELRPASPHLLGSGGDGGSGGSGGAPRGVLSATDLREDQQRLAAKVTTTPFPPQTPNPKSRFTTPVNLWGKKTDTLETLGPRLMSHSQFIAPYR